MREVVEYTGLDLFKAEMFLIAHSYPDVEIDDGVFLKCRCGDQENCRVWEADIWFVADDVQVPECLVEELKAECGKLVSSLQRANYDDL